MTAASSRTLKEARALLYPWCAVILLCMFPLLSRLVNPQGTYFSYQPDGFANFLFQIGLLLGIPMLACLSFGNEFRYKTLDLLVSQPVNRLSIWREKWIVTALAVMTATFIAILSSRSPIDFTGASSWDWVMFIVVTTCSAPFWTLLGRSTLGGLVLNIAAFLPLMSVTTSLWEWNSVSRYLNRTPAFLILSAAILSYSIVMLWMSRWMLVHRQSGAGLAGPDVMQAIPGVMPERIAALFRCRPDQVILNVIRKELRLLRPLWLLTVLYIAVWSAMAFSFSLVPDVGSWQRTTRVIFVMVTATYPVISIFLAASLPLGEERAFGVQLWHLALPLSMRTQWLTRLVSGLAAGVVSAIAVPAVLIVLARAVLRPEFMQGSESMFMVEPVAGLIGFFLFSFWCAIVARDLTRTAGMIAAAFGMMVVAFEGSMWITERLIGGIEYLISFAVSWSQLNPYTYSFHDPLGWFPDFSRTAEGTLTAVVCVLMTIHTLPLFRRVHLESGLKMVRPLVPYLVFIMTFVSLMTIRSWNGGHGVVAYELFHETETAIIKLQPASTFTVDDLAKASALSLRTRRWLHNSTMELTINDAPARNNLTPGYDWKVYNLTLHLDSGTTCKASFPFTPDNSTIVLTYPMKCD